MAVATIATLTLGLVAGYFYQIQLSRSFEQKLAQSVQQELEEVEAQQRAKTQQTAEAIQEQQLVADRDIQRRRNELRDFQGQLRQREQALDTRANRLDALDAEFKTRDGALEARHAALEKLEQANEDMRQQQIVKLESVATMTRDEAKDQLLASIERDVRELANQRVRQITAEAEETAESKARWLVGLSLQRVAAAHTTEVTTSVVDLKSDELKGRIIGREGRNIRALEAATGVDVIIDDTPETVVLSGFDPVRREIARVALQRLTVDGRIHPARIEEAVAKARTEVDEIIEREGEQAG